MQNPFGTVHKERRGEAGIANYRGELLYIVTDGWMTVAENLPEPQADFLVAAINGLEKIKEYAEKTQIAAGRAYCNYIDCGRKEECLGEKAKIENGNFGVKELNAHKQAEEYLGEHRSLIKCSKELLAILEEIRVFLPIKLL